MPRIGILVKFGSIRQKMMRCQMPRIGILAKFGSIRQGKTSRPYAAYAVLFLLASLKFVL